MRVDPVRRRPSRSISNVSAVSSGVGRRYATCSDGRLAGHADVAVVVLDTQSKNTRENAAVHDARRAFVGERERHRPGGAVAVDGDLVLAGSRGCTPRCRGRGRRRRDRRRRPRHRPGAPSGGTAVGERLLGRLQLGTISCRTSSSGLLEREREAQRPGAAAAASVRGLGRAARRRRSTRQRSCRSLGMPRMRSAMRLRWICEVPAAIVYCSDHRYSRTASASSSRRIGPRRSLGRPEHPHRQLGDLLAELAVAAASPPSRAAPASRSPRPRRCPLGHPPQRLDAGLEPADLAAAAPDRPRRAGRGRDRSGQRHQLPHLRPQGDDVLRERGAALEAQGHVGDPPAVVLVADPVA